MPELELPFSLPMAFIASAYALFTVFDNAFIAIAFRTSLGVCLFFNLDRLLFHH